MAFVHGKGTHFTIDDSGGTPRNLSAYCTEVNFPRDFDMAETSTFGNTYKTFIQGLGSATVSISGRYDSTATTGPDVVLSSLVGAANTATLVYGPEGSTAGRVRYSGEYWLASYEITGSIGDVVSFSASFQLATNAGITRDTFP